MAKLNVKGVTPASPPRTYGGAITRSAPTPIEALRRTVLSCLLWEDNFYEDGQNLAARVKDLVPKCSPKELLDLIIESRIHHGIRHTSLLVAREAARRKDISSGFISDMVATACQRADEPAEFLALYWSEKRQPVSNAVKRGLEMSLRKFGEYSLAKYDRDAKVKLRDVFRVCHPKPLNEDQNALWKRVISRDLKVPDTWEVELSASSDKKESWTRLIQEKKLGSLAVLRNVRNMEQAGVPKSLIREALEGIDAYRIFPYQFISAAKACPSMRYEIERAMEISMSKIKKLPGRTVLIVDVSGSMGMGMSDRSIATRMEAAFAMAISANQLCQDPVIYLTAGNDHSRVHATKKISFSGFGITEAYAKERNFLGGGGVFTRQCLNYVADQESGNQVDRVLLFTDEQDCDKSAVGNIPLIGSRGNYVMNVGTYQNGVLYNKDAGWVHIHGFSSRFIDFVREIEGSHQAA